MVGRVLIVLIVVVALLLVFYGLYKLLKSVYEGTKEPKDTKVLYSQVYRADELFHRILNPRDLENPDFVTPETRKMINQWREKNRKANL